MIHVDLPIVGDVGHVLEDMLKVWKSRGRKTDTEGLRAWWAQIEQWKARNCLAYRNSDKVIKPQHALQRLQALTAGRSPISPPRSASTRCGRRSSCISRIRTTG